MATAGAKRIDDDILPILTGMSFEGNVARLECGQLDRNTYTAVNKVLEALGGKWNKKLKGHAFDECPEEVIADAVSSGQHIDGKATIPVL